ISAAEEDRQANAAEPPPPAAESPRRRNSLFFANDGQSIIMKTLEKRGLCYDEFCEYCSNLDNNYIEELTCPLALGIFQDPVIIDGFTFDRETIKSYLKVKPGINPLTREPFDDLKYQVNRAVQNQILGLIDQYSKEEKSEQKEEESRKNQPAHMF